MSLQRVAHAAGLAVLVVMAGHSTPTSATAYTAMTAIADCDETYCRCLADPNSEELYCVYWPDPPKTCENNSECNSLTGVCD